MTRKNKKRIRFARELTSCLRTRSARNSVQVSTLYGCVSAASNLSFQLYASSYSYVIIAFKLKINQGLFSFWVGSVSSMRDFQCHSGTNSTDTRIKSFDHNGADSLLVTRSRICQHLLNRLTPLLTRHSPHQSLGTIPKYAFRIFPIAIISPNLR